MPKFQPGQSGNPAGKPRGAKDKRTELRALLKPHSKNLVQKAVDLALEGDTTALRLCLERLIPPIKAKAEVAPIGPLNGSLTAQGSAIITSMGSGGVSPEDASAMLRAIAAQAKITEIDELENRITRLEDQANVN